MNTYIKQASMVGLLLTGSLYAQGVKDFLKKEKLTQKEVVTQLADRKVESKTLSKDQDELSADVQELIEEQTNEKVIGLLEQVEELMAGVTDDLSVAETGKGTIYNENEIIEKIFEAAKEKSK